MLVFQKSKSGSNFTNYYWWRERIEDTFWTVLFFWSVACLTLSWVGLILLLADMDMGPLQVFDGFRLVPLGILTLLVWLMIFFIWSYVTPLLRRRMLHTVLFAIVVVLQTISANFASYLHSYHTYNYKLLFFSLTFLDELCNS